jgi:hypothetical protein
VPKEPWHATWKGTRVNRKRFPQSLKSVRIIAFAVWFNRCIPKSRTDEHRLFITSLRIRKDFVKACSKASPSASKVLGRWLDRDISSFRQNRSKSLQDVPSVADHASSDGSISLRWFVYSCRQIIAYLPPETF